MLQFDPTITLGALVNLAILVSTLVGFAVRNERRQNMRDLATEKRHAENSSRLAVLEQKIGDVWRWFIRERGQ